MRSKRLPRVALISLQIVSVLSTGAKLFVPTRQKNFYKFWWDEELNALKDASIKSNKLWKEAGKPRQGPMFNKRQLCRAKYRKAVRDGEKRSTMSYGTLMISMRHCQLRMGQHFGNVGVLSLRHVPVPHRLVDVLTPLQ